MALILRLLFLLICLLLVPAFGQRFTFTGKLGAPITTPYGDGDKSRPISMGFGGIMKLLGPMHLEVDAIHRSQRLICSPTSPDPVSGLQECEFRDNIWDIPILYRHQHGNGRVWLLGNAGLVLRGRSSTIDYIIGSNMGPRPPEQISRTSRDMQTGFLIGPGFGFKLGGGVAIEPEFRYTHLGSHSRDKVAEVMIGIRFGVRDR